MFRKRRRAAQHPWPEPGDLPELGSELGLNAERFDQFGLTDFEVSEGGDWGGRGEGQGLRYNKRDDCSLLFISSTRSLLESFSNHS
jgi:hypothetical protein